MITLKMGTSSRRHFYRWRYHHTIDACRAYFQSGDDRGHYFKAQSVDLSAAHAIMAIEAPDMLHQKSYHADDRHRRLEDDAWHISPRGVRHRDHARC